MMFDISYLIEWCDEHEGFATAMVGLIAVLIAIVGWFFTYKFQIRSQNKQMLNQIANDARKDLVSNFRKYQEWLMKFYLYIDMLSSKLHNYEHNGEFDWASELKTYRLIIEEIPIKWNFVLEESEILFPETRDIRIRLQKRHQKILDFALWFQVNFFNPDDLPLIGTNKRVELVQRKNSVIVNSEKALEYILDQCSLSEDIKIYIQNKCLNEITGNELPERTPPDNSIPRIIVASDGKLNIINEKDFSVIIEKL